MPKPLVIEVILFLSIITICIQYLSHCSNSQQQTPVCLPILLSIAVYPSTILMSLRRSSRQNETNAALTADQGTIGDSGVANPQQFVCHYCHKRCKSQHYLHQHQQQNTLCSIMAASNLQPAATYPPQLVATAMSNVVPSTMNQAAGNSPFDFASVMLPSNLGISSARSPSGDPSDMDILLDEDYLNAENDRLSNDSDHFDNDLDELLNNEPLPRIMNIILIPDNFHPPFTTPPTATYQQMMIHSGRMMNHPPRLVKKMLWTYLIYLKYQKPTVVVFHSTPLTCQLRRYAMLHKD